MLQCVAVCCSVLQCVAVRCCVLQCVYELRTCNVGANDPEDMVSLVCCSVLQCVAVCCSVLRCVAVCCSVPMKCGKPVTSELTVEETRSLWCVAACCSALQCAYTIWHTCNIGANGREDMVC